MFNFQFTGPYQGHVWTLLSPYLHIFSFQLAKILKSFVTESTWYKGYISSIQNWHHTQTIFGPCIGHIWPSSTSRLATALKSSKLSQLFARDMLMQCLF